MRALSRWGIPERMSAAQVLALVGAAEPSGHVLVVLRQLRDRRLLAAEQATVLSLLGRMSSWLMALTDEAVVAVAGMTEPVEDDWTRDEIALALRMSTRSSPARIRQARERCGRLSRVGAALAAGVLLPGQADDAVDELLNATAETVDRVCDRLLADAGGMTRERFRRSLRRAVISSDPPAAALRHELAKAERGVWMRPLPDGMAEVITLMTAVEAVTFTTGLDAAAHQRIAAYKAAVAAATAQDPTAVFEGLSMGAARCEVMLAWAQQALAEPGLPRAQGRRVEIGLTMTMDTYRGLADDPVLLDGYGPITADQARELLPEAALRRLLTDPLSGELLDYGRTTYRPPQHLTDFVVARQRRCLIQGCPQPARLCDLDHRVPYGGGGGRTSGDNLDPLCERHHALKTSGAWQLVKDANGSLWLVTAAGVRYPLRREPVDPTHHGPPDPSHQQPWAVPDAALVEQAIAHANLWAKEDARRRTNADADLDPPF